MIPHLPPMISSGVPIPHPLGLRREATFRVPLMQTCPRMPTGPTSFPRSSR